MSRKAVQITVGVLILLFWGMWGAYAVPVTRLQTLANYPNPFDSRRSPTTIVYSLTQDARVTVRLYDLLGTLVRAWDFSSGQAGGLAGDNRFAWDGTDESGRAVSAGGYICQVVAEEEQGVTQGTRKIGVIR